MNYDKSGKKEQIEVLINEWFNCFQFLSVLSIYEVFRMMTVNQRYRKYKKTLEVKGHYREWWIYAKTAICEEFIRPYSWGRIQEHRFIASHLNVLHKCFDTSIRIHICTQGPWLSLASSSDWKPFCSCFCIVRWVVPWGVSLDVEPYKVAITSQSYTTILHCSITYWKNREYSGHLFSSITITLPSSFVVSWKPVQPPLADVLHWTQLISAVQSKRTSFGEKFLVGAGCFSHLRCQKLFCNCVQ